MLPEDDSIIVNFRYQAAAMKIDRKTKDIRWQSEEKTGPGMFWCRVGNRIYVKNAWGPAEDERIEPGMEIIEHFAKVSLVSRLLGGERLLPREEVSRLLDLRKKVFGLEGPPGGEQCPIPAETAAPVAGARIQLTREELENLILDAIREMGSTGKA